MTGLLESYTLSSNEVIHILLDYDPEDSFHNQNEPEDLSRYGL